MQLINKTMESNASKIPYCTVCKVSIGMLSKKLECSVCKLNVCKEHYVIRENSNFRCETCEKTIVKNMNFSDYEYQIAALKKDLEYLGKDKNKYKKELFIKEGIISRLETQLTNNQISHVNKVEIIEKKVSDEVSKLKTQQLLLEHLENTFTESQKCEQLMMEKLNMCTNELENTKIDFEELNADQMYISLQIDKLNLELHDKVPISRLKLLACTGCYKSIKINFWEMMRQAFIIEGRDSMLASISRPSVLNPITSVSENSACRCIII